MVRTSEGGWRGVLDADVFFVSLHVFVKHALHALPVLAFLASAFESSSHNVDTDCTFHPCVVVVFQSVPAPHLPTHTNRYETHHVSTDGCAYMRVLTSFSLYSYQVTNLLLRVRALV